MTIELTVLALIDQRLGAEGFPYMLTGSFAHAHYATPRMTRDLDIVVQISEAGINRLVAAFADDFYIDADAVRSAIRSQTLFNLMHLESGLKVDFIVRKTSAFRQTEFERRRRVPLGQLEVWIVSREDLILSKLVWARETGSEQQRRDIRDLLAGVADMDYIRTWATALGVGPLLEDLAP